MSPQGPHNPDNPTPAEPEGNPAPESAAPPTPVPPAKKPGLLRSLGQFAGHVASGLKTPATPPSTTQQTHKSVEEETTTDEQGRTVVLRRTTIEEVELKDDAR